VKTTNKTTEHKPQIPTSQPKTSQTSPRKHVVKKPKKNNNGETEQTKSEIFHYQLSWSSAATGGQFAFDKKEKNVHASAYAG